MTQELHFFLIKDDFITAIRAIDNRVQHNYGGTRPYIGVLLVVNGLKYFAPLSSYKEKQERIKNISVFKLYERGNPNNKLGVIHLNNMFPVPDDKLIPVVIDVQDHYGLLLNNQYEYIVSRKEALQKQAQTLYNLVNNQRIKGQTTTFTNVCCDYKLLEQSVQTIMATEAANQTN